MIFLLYFLAGCLLLFLVATILFQYYVALGSLHKVLAAFASDRILSALWLSITSSIATTIFALMFGVPLAYLFAMKQFWGKIPLETLVVDVPQTFPPVAEGMIFLLMLGPASPFHVNLTFTFTALVIAKFFISAPFVVSTVARRFRDIQKSGINLTARSLGANPFQVFTTIFIPMSFTDIAAGATLCWSRAMGELGGSLIFAGVIPFRTEVLPTFIALDAKTLTAEALAATILGTTASMLALVTFKKLTLKEER
ncbi:MAG: ABC transporter permease subunit [Candidatus Sungbacteria bacterium]|uniref:ABC transporter permease subunit n=1 Tax=Candidatus Sungiibacteriota bacterium TaxID=2750080 RepID=A0A932R198_9BACT|nr:ABC transporter permease subunit [Candidatus Sungbacteria bacterium]